MQLSGQISVTSGLRALRQVREPHGGGWCHLGPACLACHETKPRCRGRGCTSIQSFPHPIPCNLTRGGAVTVPTFQKRKLRFREPSVLSLHLKTSRGKTGIPRLSDSKALSLSAALCCLPWWWGTQRLCSLGGLPGGGRPLRRAWRKGCSEQHHP